VNSCQRRTITAELHHARRDLIDLRLAVRARVALICAQAFDRPELDPVGERDQGARGVRTCSQSQRGGAMLESLKGGNDAGLDPQCSRHHVLVG
jgi:hypothetical protein